MPRASLVLSVLLPLTVVAAGGWLSAPPAAKKKPAVRVAAKGKKTEARITAKKGGQLAAADRKARVMAHAGVVSEDTTFTIQQLTGYDEPRLRSRTYRLGPNGKFKKDVEICLSLGGKADPGDLCLGYFDDKSGGWKCEDVCLEKSGDQLCGSTDHFTNFALLLSGGAGKNKDSCDDDEDTYVTGRSR